MRQSPLPWIPFPGVMGIHVGASTERCTTGTRALAGGIVGLGANTAFQWTTVKITEPGVSTVILSRDLQPYVLDKLRPILDAFEHREAAPAEGGLLTDTAGSFWGVATTESVCW